MNHSNKPQVTRCLLRNLIIAAHYISAPRKIAGGKQSPRRLTPLTRYRYGVRFCGKPQRRRDQLSPF